MKERIILNTLKKELEQTLHCEKSSYESCGYDDDVIKGWIEALEYVLAQINSYKCNKEL
jgi:hypothetical protein